MVRSTIPPPSDAAEFERAVKAAFNALRSTKLGKARVARARAFVPWMSKTRLYDRFGRNDFLPGRQGRPSLLPDEAEMAVYKFAEEQFDIGKPVGARTIGKKLTLLTKAFDKPSNEYMRARGMKGFLKRTGSKIVKGQKTDQARFFAVTHDKVGRFADISGLALTGVQPKNTYVTDECGFSAEQDDMRVSTVPERVINSYACLPPAPTPDARPPQRASRPRQEVVARQAHLRARDRVRDGPNLPAEHRRRGQVAQTELDEGVRGGQLGLDDAGYFAEGPFYDAMVKFVKDSEPEGGAIAEAAKAADKLAREKSKAEAAAAKAAAKAAKKPKSAAAPAAAAATKRARAPEEDPYARGYGKSKK